MTRPLVRFAARAKAARRCRCVVCCLEDEDLVLLEDLAEGFFRRLPADDRVAAAGFRLRATAPPDVSGAPPRASHGAHQR